MDMNVVIKQTTEKPTGAHGYRMNQWRAKSMTDDQREGRASRRRRKGSIEPETIETMQEVVRLRKQRYSYEQIASELRLSTSWCHELFQRARRELIRDDLETIIDLECRTLDDMQASLSKNALQGDTGAINATLKIQERRARLLGLDAPARAEHSGPSGRPFQVEKAVTVDQARAEIAELFAELAK
jgi:hypothetical protein